MCNQNVYCGENHPANYRGCSVAIELQKIKNKHMTVKNPSTVQKQKQIITKEKQPEKAPANVKNSTNQNTKKEGNGNIKSYAQVTRNNASQSTQVRIQQKDDLKDDLKQTLHLIINKLNALDERLLAIECSTSSKGVTPKPKHGQRS